MVELPIKAVILPPIKLNITEILASPGMTPLISGVAVLVQDVLKVHELPTESTLLSVTTTP